MKTKRLSLPVFRRFFLTTRLALWEGYFGWATFVGILPLTIGIAYLGGNIDRLKTGLIWVSVISLLAFAIYVIYDRQKKKQDQG